MARGTQAEGAETAQRGTPALQGRGHAETGGTETAKLATPLS
jgi:hypothetical protein